MACFFSRPVPLWVAPEDCPSPFRHIICIFLRHPTNVMSLPVSSFLADPSSASFSQYKHLLSSVHVQATSVLTIVFSLQIVPPECMRTGVSVQLAYVRFCTNRREVSNCIEERGNQPSALDEYNYPEFLCRCILNHRCISVLVITDADI